MNIHAYANHLICIILLQFEEKFMRFHLIPLRFFFLHLNHTTQGAQIWLRMFQGVCTFILNDSKLSKR
jgi:hypothetical protein